MRSDRLVSLLLLLQSRNPQCARELARSLEVSSRTIYRDVDALSAAGVPIYAERCSNGGIALADGYRRTLAQFSTEELQALFVSAADPLADLGVTGHHLALSKLAGGLSDAQQRTAQEAGSRVLIDHRRWYRAEQPTPLLAVLRRAVWSDRRLELDYRDRSGKSTQRTIDPFALVSKAGVWYLIARKSDGEMRTFRAERIAGAREIDERFERPADFDLDAYWRSSMEAVVRPVERCEVLMRVRTDVAAAIASWWDSDMVREEPEGTLLRVRFPGKDAALFQAMAWGDRVDVIEPAELRDRIVERARAILAAYAAS